MPEKRRALLSVSDKTGIQDFAQGLTALGWEIVATGGTAKELSAAKIPVRTVMELTGFPEILDGRVKTLHPKIFGALLAKGLAAHEKELRTHEISPIHLVAVNLYPFAKLLETGNMPEEDLLEYVDVGGAALLRAGAKNHARVIVLSDPRDYEEVLSELREFGDISPKDRRRLAFKAFSHTAYYDAVVSQTLGVPSAAQIGGSAFGGEDFPPELSIPLKRKIQLRYGENPHQKAALYMKAGDRAWGIAQAQSLQGKPLSYNNFLDMEIAWDLVGEFQEPACAIIKHTTPSGAGASEKLSEAFRQARDTDALSAFGGILGFNREVDEETAREVSKIFFECVIAPAFSEGARAIFKSKKNLRLLVIQSSLVGAREQDIKSVSGGILLQERDHQTLSQEPKAITRRPPSAEETMGLLFAWRVAKHTKSNAVVLASGRRTLGIGSGQTSRVDALRAALLKINGLHPILNLKSPLVMASDGFITFRDVLDEAAKAGVSAIIQPGGSIHDKEIIAAANEKGMSMVATGIRHFKH